MTCCIVGLFILAGIGRVRRFFGTARTGMLFAPVAYRPGPGQPSAPSPESAAVAGREADHVLRYCALGIAVCLVGGPVLVWAGAVQNTGSPAVWLLRSAAYLALSGAAIGLSRRASMWRAPRGAGTLLVIVGAVIFELSISDMHVFGVFTIDLSDTTTYLVFHNIGPVLAVVGGLVLLYGSTGCRNNSRRSSRSTVTSARPSSSAVTVSSTPPVTA